MSKDIQNVERTLEASQKELQALHEKEASPEQQAELEKYKLVVRVLKPKLKLLNQQLAEAQRKVQEGNKGNQGETMSKSKM